MGSEYVGFEIYCTFASTIRGAICDYGRVVAGQQPEEVTCGNSSVGRASASQAEGREFEPRFPL